MGLWGPFLNFNRRSGCWPEEAFAPGGRRSCSASLAWRAALSGPLRRAAHIGVSPPPQHPGAPATCSREKTNSVGRSGKRSRGRSLAGGGLRMQFGRGFQCSLVMFYNPDPATMASFTALAHVEQNVRGGPSRGEAGLRAPTPGAEPRCWEPPAGVSGDAAGGR